MLNKSNRKKMESKMRKQKMFHPLKGKISILAAIVCLPLSIFSSLSLAETQPANQPTNAATHAKEASEKIAPKTNNAGANAPTKKAPVLVAPKAATRDQKDVFKPSEEISEDFAVPFPVDI